MICLEILEEMEALEDELSENFDAQNYVESVMSKSRDICENVERFERESDGQIRAMQNMRDGMEKWLKDF